MRFVSWSILLLTVLVSGCQSSRFAAFRPDAPTYHVPTSSQPAPVVAAEPAVLEATTNSGTFMAEMPPSVSLRKRTTAALPAEQKSAAVTAPDTLYGRPVGRGWPQAASTPDVFPKTDSSVPDPATTTVNVIGGTLVAAGLVTLVVNADSDSGSGTDWGRLFLGLIALSAIPIGVALLLYQGKNGRQRLKREARRQARKGTVPDATAAPASSESGPSDRPLRRIGIGLLLGGAVLLAVGALLSPYGLLFFGLPGLILLIAGLIVSVSAI
ncbi:hypothetical protein Hsw_3127 [Hymenobacter swuensis DY53]|uniref:Uncharacterized protein n=1 Tax=Hymenobacter swuensis DY53 TaxID=1227739 RepID=W8F3X1_9BACT|nr:hypothetical protein Hsw_3127 [Hymenobacter swuensis DY53]